MPIEFKTNYARRRFFGRGEMRAAGCFDANTIRKAKRAGKLRRRYHQARKRLHQVMLSRYVKISNAAPHFVDINGAIEAKTNCSCKRCDTWSSR